MLNSFTNFLHALALATYAFLVYVGIAAGEPFYTSTLLTLFTMLFVLKLFGVAVHFPWVEARPSVRNMLWACVALGVVMLNTATLFALPASPVVVALGVFVSAFATVVFLYILRTHVRYAPIALSFITVYLLAALSTCGLLRLGFLLVVASNVLWVVLSYVPYLRSHAYHNDLYHLALIGSTFVLFRSIEVGLWEVSCAPW